MIARAKIYVLPEKYPSSTAVLTYTSPYLESIKQKKTVKDWIGEMCF